MITVPVVFACDNGFAMQTAVSLTSLYANKSDNTYYEIYILVPQSFTLENREKISSIVTQDDSKISFVEIDNKLDNAYIYISHITYVTYYRLLIPQLFPQYDKMIYADGDIIFNDDLSGLYNQNIDEHCCSVVRHVYMLITDNKYTRETLQLKQEKYFNAGFLVLNLKKIRDEKLDKMLLEETKKNYERQDQDVLNIVFYDKVNYIDYKYNVITKNIPFIFNEFRDKIVDYEQFITSYKFPSVIHYADKEKPWKDRFLPYGELWKRYFDASPYAGYELSYQNEEDYNLNDYVFEKESLNVLYYTTLKENQKNKKELLRITDNNANIKEKRDELIEKHKELREKHNELKEKHKELREKHYEQKEKYDKLKEKQKELKIENKELRESLQTRFQEIADLTKIVYNNMTFDKEL